MSMLFIQPINVYICITSLSK